MATLSFGVIGDTRPADACTSTPCSSYPTSIVDNLYSDLTSYSPQIGFVVATGDYQYNTPGSGTASWQVGQYYSATQTFTATGRPVYPTMGNHECTGYTDSECGAAPGGSGATENYTAFLSDLLGPLGLPNANPYYQVNVTIADGSTAKFLMVTPNAWDSTQETWLTNALAQQTTYTFIVQHEANNLDQTGSSAPASLSTIRSVVTASGTPASGETYPVTLWLVGHTHNYDYDSTNQQMILGLGGAPTDSIESGESSSTFFSGNSGAYAICSQQASGTPPAIQCELIDGSSNMPAGQSFAVNANGSAATVQ